MQHHIQTLVKQFFQKESLQEVSADELQKFTEEFPYSAAGQYLYAKKLKETGGNESGEQLEKSTLYFHNPIWASWLLQERERFIEHSPETIIRQPSLATYSTVEESTVPVQPIRVPVQPEPVAPVQEFVEVPTPAAEQPVNETDSITPGIKEAEKTQENIPAEIAVDAPEENLGMDNINTDIPAVENKTEQPSEPMPVVEEQHSTDQAKEKPATTPEEPGEPADNDDIPFDSYHTIDYFASQGIKLKPEDLPKDRLGQQLKSFTDWLRSMKRINPAEDINTLDEITNQAIQQIAEHSVSGKEIITEAMAEVWAKQGHREKAVAIYEKLSLLNPAKTTYFATRIEQLKAV